MPASIKLRGRQGKYIFKSAVADLLPPEIVNRPKMGFPTPLRDWLAPAAAAPLLDALEDPNGFLASITDRATLQAMLARHRRGEIDGTDRVWRLLNFQIWGDQFLTGRGSERWESILGVPVSPPA